MNGYTDQHEKERLHELDELNKVIHALERMHQEIADMPLVHVDILEEMLLEIRRLQIRRTLIIDQSAYYKTVKRLQLEEREKQKRYESSNSNVHS
ncbi:hypothetical protein LCGC14_1596920 [marine sediment metagenome]|uniref:Uncharacterized protein n=1 Tax=marine sediment metagenome TaxID=412755 RepID=A0A0F9ICD9_9ZZZZ